MKKEQVLEAFKDYEVYLTSYFEGIIERDRHHIRQIDSFLTEKKQRSV